MLAQQVGEGKISKSKNILIIQNSIFFKEKEKTKYVREAITKQDRCASQIFN